MGGTTAKLCAVENGYPLKAREFEVDRVYRFRKGSGLPIKIPVIDMIEIGAGGGSIARVDALGLLKVGPESAGAEPGPACLRPRRHASHGHRRESDPRLLRSRLLSRRRDEARRGRGAAGPGRRRRRARHARGGGGLGHPSRSSTRTWPTPPVPTWGNAARTRGSCPCTPSAAPGPVHGCNVAELLHLPTVISPMGAGVGSTFGLLAAPLAFDFVRSVYSRLDELDWSFVNGHVRRHVRRGARHPGAVGTGVG